jgi:hypothetical protein
MNAMRRENSAGRMTGASPNSITPGQSRLKE